MKNTNPAEKVLEIINRVYYRGLTTTSGGNISTIDEEGNIYITPSAIDKGRLTLDDIIKVRPDGTVEGKHKPSCELPFHSNVYKLRPDIKAIVHAHAPAIVAFAVTRTIPNVHLTSHTEKMCSNISTSAYSLPGSLKLGNIIAEEFKKGYDIVMMDSHGAVVGGKDLDEAYSLYESLDFAARMHINANTAGCSLAEYRTKNKIEPPAAKTFVNGSQSEEEQKQRQEICDLCKRSYTLNITSCLDGTLAVKLEDGSILITPAGKDRNSLTPEDIVKIKDGQVEEGKTPDPTYAMLLSIYEKHPEFNTLYLAYPPHIMAFVLSGKNFNARLIPESYIMLRDIKTAPFSALADGTISETISTTVPVVLVEKECVLTAGKTPLQAFDRLEVLEYSANSVLSALKLGNIASITDAEVKEINENFQGW